MSAFKGSEPAYTTRFLCAANYSGGSPYVVPAGMRAVVRHIDLSLNSAGAVIANVFIEGVQIYTNTLARPGPDYAFWDGYAVALEGERIEATPAFGVGSFDVNITGYLFSGP